MISKVCPNISPDCLKELQPLFDDVCVRYNITSLHDKAAFAAQMAHESGCFKIKSENMNYKTPQRIVAVWPSRFTLTGEPGKLNANDYTNNPEKLANEVYANRMGNGDQHSGDGFRFRGAGFLQLTGREDHEKYAKYINKDTPENLSSEVLRSDDYFAFDSAAWEYVIQKKLLGEKDFKKITKAINGGLIGYEDRLKLYERALK